MPGHTRAIFVANAHEAHPGFYEGGINQQTGKQQRGSPAMTTMTQQCNTSMLSLLRGALTMIAEKARWSHTLG
jgi:hypothetical protein